MNLTINLSLDTEEGDCLMGVVNSNERKSRKLYLNSDGAAAITAA
jgi:hypothetical protein